MTATQSLKFFEISKRYFQNDNDARSFFIEEIDNVVDNKFKAEKDTFTFASMSSVDKVDYKIELLRQEMKTGFSEIKSELRAEFNRQLIWLVGVMFALSGLIIAAIKLLF